MGRGLCSRCYQDRSVVDLYDPLIQGGDGDVADDSTGMDDFEAQLQADDPARGVGGGSVGEDPLSADDSPYTTGEQRPGSSSRISASAPPPSKPRGLKGLFAKKAKPEAAPQPSTREKRPKVTKAAGRRTSGADTLSDIWSAGGSLLMRSGHVPTGRMLQFQSAVAGEMLDEAVKGSIVDKVAIQPIVKARGRFDLLGAVLGPPMIVFAIERNPERAPMLMPALKSSIRSSLPLMVPAIKKVQEKERKAAEAAAELFPDLPPGEDPVDAIIASLFDNWAPPAAPEPEEPAEADLEEEMIP